MNDEGAREIWAYGLRNPWRITIDRDLVFIADVAFDGSEEVNVIRLGDSGLNFGWPVMEGMECYDSDTCDSTGMTPSVLIVPHSRACAIIGGPVYRGFDIPELHGHYVFGDYCFGWMRSAPVSDGGLGEVVDWEPMLGTIGNITTFGIDTDGELLVATQGRKCVPGHRAAVTLLRPLPVGPLSPPSHTTPKKALHPGGLPPDAG